MNLSRSNIFCTSTDEMLELFADYLEGSRSCIALVVSENALGPIARNAVEKSLESFGYGADVCTYATLGEEGGPLVPLDANALFLLVESLDPVLVVCADKVAAEAVGRAFRCALELDAPVRVFGRPAVAFNDLSGMLDSEQGKQHAWRILKTLPRRS